MSPLGDGVLAEDRCVFVTQVLKHVFCRRKLLLMVVVVGSNKLVYFALVVSGL